VFQCGPVWEEYVAWAQAKGVPGVKSVADLQARLAGGEAEGSEVGGLEDIL
jgi:hypothetical protein